MIKIEKSTINIKGKDYNFLKPTAVDLIEIEDGCFGLDGKIDGNKYNREMLAIVSKSLKVDDLVEFNKTDCVMSDDSVISIPEIGYETWANKMAELDSFSRVKLAKFALDATGVSGEIKLTGFKYEDIDALATAYFSLYNNEELKRVVDEVATFCFS